MVSVLADQATGGSIVRIDERLDRAAGLEAVGPAE
jgi:hypothetical protein